ncbi:MULTISPECIES: serine hydrolase domain-containing protein [Pseudonocardia]|uniref:FmtA-like protein n=1 Tax=Pseudonocardia saturnea TaxID=33909 RepID=A0ABQ0S843_9PSEU|nr:MULTISPECIES: serine hydrolase domain-containing protein [Pseudonocardia]BBG05542.1 FmtA-like protein [Pseudonocardia autotrophica]GEC29041.1 FmtA-like protein [Pseudonocardia saturnea]
MSAPPVTAELTGTDVDAWLDGLLPSALERSGIAGATVAVVHDGELLTARGFGHAGGAPVDPDRTLFRVGSVSKVVTATAVLQQVEQGRIELDADVRQYLDFPLPLRFEPPVTMRHLLTHTAGFEEQVRGLISHGESSPDLREVLAADPPEQVFSPGTTPAYSNYGYALAGYVVERVTGTPFEEQVRHAVLEPAGMTSSTFAQPLPEGLRDRLSAGYPNTDEPAMPFETVGPAPAGSLSASATDMARFVRALLDEPGAGSLLAPETAELMRTPGLGPDTLGTIAEGPRMTLGMFDESRNGRLVLGHGGDTTLFHSHLQVYPAERTGVFVSMNSNGRGAIDTLEIRRALLDGFADRYFPAAGDPLTPAPEAAGSSDRAAAVAGRYESTRAAYSTFLSALGMLGQTEVTARPDGTLLVTSGPGSVRPAGYREIRPAVWQEIGGNRLLTTRTTGDRVTEIGFESAFTLQRTGPFRDSSTAGPVLAVSATALLVGLLAWPVGALLRRRGMPARPSPGRADRILHLLTRFAAGCALVALAGWATVLGMVSVLAEVPVPLLHALQAAQ